MSAALEARVVALERALDRLTRRLGKPFALARSTLAPNDAAEVQLVQLQLDALSARDNVPVLYGYGVTGCPPAGGDFHVAFLDSGRYQAIAIASGHQSYRLKGLSPGDAALYDSRGAYLWLTSAGPVINGAGNPTVIQGDLHVTGKIYAGYGTADQVGVQSHTHTQPNDGHGDAEYPTSAPTAGT